MIWLLENIPEQSFKGYTSFKRLAKDIGLQETVQKPDRTLKIGHKYVIRKIEVDERI